MAEDKREPTRALDKASRVMDALAAENGLSPADIADACDIPRSSVSVSYTHLTLPTKA